MNLEKIYTPVKYRKSSDSLLSIHEHNLYVNGMNFLSVTVRKLPSHIVIHR